MPPSIWRLSQGNIHELTILAPSSWLFSDDDGEEEEVIASVGVVTEVERLGGNRANRAAMAMSSGKLELKEREFRYDESSVVVDSVMDLLNAESACAIARLCILLTIN